MPVYIYIYIYISIVHAHIARALLYITIILGKIHVQFRCAYNTITTIFQAMRRIIISTTSQSASWCQFQRKTITHIGDGLYVNSQEHKDNSSWIYIKILFIYCMLTHTIFFLLALFSLFSISRKKELIKDSSEAVRMFHW